MYLELEQAAALRRAAAQSGRSQAQVIRDALERETAATPPRVFKSHGVGRGGGEAIGRHADEIVRREMGKRKL